MLNTTIFMLTDSMEQYVRNMEPLILSNVLFTVLIGAGLVIFFYGAGHIWEWICRKLEERKKEKKG